MVPHDLVLDFPLPRPHTGFALGNGSFGVLVWSPDEQTLSLTVSRNDFWDRRFGGGLPEGITYEQLKRMAPSATPDEMRVVSVSLRATRDTVVCVEVAGVDSMRNEATSATVALPVRLELSAGGDIQLRQH